MAFARQIGQNLGRNLFALLRSLASALQQKFAMPSQRSGHHCFARFHPKLSCRENCHY